MIKPLLILSVATLTFALSDDLSCYDCDPSKTGKCEEPDKNSIKETRCKDLSEKHPQSVAVSVFNRAHFNNIRTTLEPKSAKVEKKIFYHCVSLKYVPNADSDLNEFPEGIYRGCVIRQEGDSSDPCQVATNNILGENKGTVAACSSCNDSLCNRDVPKGGASSFSLSGIAIFSALVCFYLADF